MKTTELYDVYQCPACKLTMTTDDIKNIFNYNELQAKNSKKTPQELGEDERFEDDPRALKEVDNGRVVRIPTQISKGGIDYD